MSHADNPTRGDGVGPGVESPYLHVQNSPHFGELRRKFRSFAFPLTAFFLVWYFLYVLLAAYAPGFMSTKLVGNINVGLVFGLLQFVTTFGITIAYVRWAGRTFDPLADAIRDEMNLQDGAK